MYMKYNELLNVISASKEVKRDHIPQLQTVSCKKNYSCLGVLR